mmetsp:Transcript_4445/g.8550  ORF Transcript_4445/g.8550 Transcript_4445/m.8550 type:complete len:296 (+) Transcript_4445:143-1030(+)|eukprot:CAMPEP_0176498600 /NCGR_PEP_ID=MMETSP0200_2-20121128/12417_1 /TAXON_ID=947934 /ORGANISM="Chaetoceros sp., Strain GSL56" /LENGTH=295 /DNA_ID=CAMNT_0017896837 /DNA_START=133 /DNA_END=1020 /DNA_ORIENTATION=-
MSVAQPSIPPTQLPDTKVLQDLSTVIEKINLCTTMLHPLNSTQEVDQDESLLTIIGFLEACVPRVRELIEAGMTGALQEDTVVKCLAVNDSLCQVLEFVEHPEKCVAVAAAVRGEGVGVGGDGGGSKDVQRNQQTQTQGQPKDDLVQEFDAFGITDDDDDDFFATSTTSLNADANDSKLPAKKESTPMVVNSKKTSALEDLLLTPSDALPIPPPPAAASSSASASSSRGTTGNVTSKSGTETVTETKTVTVTVTAPSTLVDPSTNSTTTNPTNDAAAAPVKKDPIQDEFDSFFDD